MGKTIGIYKDLRDNEEILAETPDIVIVEGGSSMFGSDNISAKIYLTNQRLLFLILGLVDRQKVKTPLEQSFETAMADSKLMEAMGTLYGFGTKAGSKNIVSVWSEIPLEAIEKVDTPKFTRDVLELKCSTIKKGVMDKIFRKPPVLRFHVDNRDMWRIHIESALKKLS
jgi:hypothetical protein